MFLLSLSHYHSHNRIQLSFTVNHIIKDYYHISLKIIIIYQIMPNSNPRPLHNVPETRNEEAPKENVALLTAVGVNIEIYI